MLPVQQALEGFIGPRTPWWVNLTYLFWWLVMFGFGSLVMFRRLIDFRSSDWRERWLLAGFVGSLATVVIGAVMTVGVVHGGLSRYIWVGPLFLAPALVELLTASKARRYQLVACAVVGAFLLPTFLANGSKFSRDRTYLHELVIAERMRDTFGNGDGLTIYATTGTPVFTLLYMSEPRFRVTIDPYAITEETLQTSVLSVVRDFLKSFGGNAAVFFAWPKYKASYQERLGIPPDAPLWRTADTAVSAAGRIYDVGDLQVYVP
jgi:hypothetical protein